MTKRLLDTAGSKPDHDPRFYLPLKPDVFLILTILAAGDRHGYGIMQAAEAWAGRGMEIQAGALYRRLKWMLGEGMIEEMGEEGTGRDRRRIYRITEFGRSVAGEEAARMSDLLAAARDAVLVPGGKGS